LTFSKILDSFSSRSDFFYTLKCEEPDNIPSKEGVIEAFYTFAQQAQQREADALIKEESLNEDAARRYIRNSLKREYASENGTALNETLPKLSPLNPQYKSKKKTVFQKVSAFIDKFKGVGGSV
ncbi:type I restriction endonuclease subunit R, EcoR124 family, partial [Pseudomonas helleri]|uniref:type I restriction endonuclease subunit R, EcoR124 family n=1 Tax=Pseudomonas helleri TaxID=1608996 RepID=UPI001E45092E